MISSRRPLLSRLTSKVSCSVTCVGRDQRDWKKARMACASSRQSKSLCCSSRVGMRFFRLSTSARGISSSCQRCQKVSMVLVVPYLPSVPLMASKSWE